MPVVEIIKDPRQLEILAGGKMGGGGYKKPPTTPNDRDNEFHDDYYEPIDAYKDLYKINNGRGQPLDRYLNPRQGHFNIGHNESKREGYM